MTDAEFWQFTVRMLVGVALVAGPSLVLVWLGSRDFDRRYGRDPK